MAAQPPTSKTPPIEFVQTGKSAIPSAEPENPTVEPNKANRMIRRRDIAISIFQDGRPAADLENPTVEPNMKWIGRPLEDVWPIGHLKISQMRGWSVGGWSVLNIYFFLH